MQARHRLGELPRIGRVVVMIGVFDGVHRGHQSLAAAMRTAARQRGARGVALVIDPHPDEVFAPERPVARLTGLERTAALLASEGVDEVVVVEFSRDVAALTPEAFLDSLGPGIEPVGVLMTEESRFGRQRSGTPDVVRGIGERRGFDVVLAPLVEAAGGVISSSRIRSLIAGGRLAEARELLGRPHAADGLLEPTSADGGAWSSLVPAYPAALPPEDAYSVTVTPLGEPPGSSWPAQARVQGGSLLVEMPAQPSGERPVRVDFA